MIALDASTMIAALKRTDAQHRTASTILDSDSGFMAHTETLVEVLAGGARIGRSDAMLETLIDLGVLEAERVDGEAMALARLRAETLLRMPDCCVLLVAETRAAMLATFDVRLARVARARGVTVLDGTSDADL